MIDSFKSTYVAQLFFFFFNDTATTEIYTLSLHDALPISWKLNAGPVRATWVVTSSAMPRRIGTKATGTISSASKDRKSTRLNSSHQIISYAVFCLKKKKTPLVKIIRTIQQCNTNMT